MKKFLGDCPALVKKIDNDALNKKDLHQIVDEYNTCMTNPAPAAGETSRFQTDKKSRRLGCLGE